MTTNVSMSKIVFDVPMQKMIMKYVDRLNNVPTGNTGTMGILPRWSSEHNLNIPVELTTNKRFPGLYVIKNGRHRIAKLYLQGRRTVKAKLKI